jgi:very-short-patch-repair endonuclease
MRTNTNPTTLRARELRQTANPSEQKLWTHLKGRQLGGYKFTRQYPIGPYFADFACRQQSLIIELDGSQHIDNEHDAERDAYLLAEGYAILHLPSATVLRDCESVCETILAALDGRLDEATNFDLSFRKPTVEPRKVTRRRAFVANNPRPRERGGSRGRARRGGCLLQAPLSNSRIRG